MAVDCCNLSEMIGLIAHQKPVVYLSLDQRPENRNGFRFVKQRKQTAERLQQSIGNSTYPDTRSRVSFLTGGRLPRQLIPLARAGQAYRLRRRRAGMSKPAIFPNWPAGQERLSGIFPHYIHKVHPNPHDLRAIGHQNDTGRDQAAYRGAGSFRRNNSSPSTAVGKSPVPGVRCAISLDSSPSSISTDLLGIIL